MACDRLSVKFDQFLSICYSGFFMDFFLMGYFYSMFKFFRLEYITTRIIYNKGLNQVTTHPECVVQLLSGINEWIVFEVPVFLRSTGTSKRF